MAEEARCFCDGDRRADRKGGDPLTQEGPVQIPPSPLKGSQESLKNQRS